MLCLLALCTISMWFRFSHIQGTVPYPYHVDEAAVIGPARSMLVTGDLHPGTFNYPSLPKYLAAIGLAGGFLRAAREGEIANVQQIGPVAYPYYGTPTAVQGARWLFALLSVVALGMTGVVAWFVTQRSAVIFVGPLTLMSSNLFFSHSWRYLNVDIVGACFVVLAVASCLQAAERPSFTRSAVIPGLWVGLATASKYTLGVVLVPVLLGIWIYQDADRRFLTTLAAVATSCVTFLVVVPYSILDLPAFLNGLAAEARHYNSGHTGFDANPGMAQLGYYARHFVAEFGIVGGILAVLGLSSVVVRDRRLAVLLTAFPVALIALLVVQRVNFPRNVLAIHPFYAVLVGYGLIVLHRTCTRVVERRSWVPKYRPHVTAVLACVLVVVVLPPQRFLAQARGLIDSRHLARTWMVNNVPPGWTVVIPSALGFDTRHLDETWDFDVVEVDVMSVRQQRDMLASLRGEAIAFVPTWGADGRFETETDPAEMNKGATAMRVVEEFGINPVLLNYRPPTAWGNPRFRVVVGR